MTQQTRRQFLRNMGGTAAFLSVQPLAKIAANDKIRIGCVGMGIMGFANLTDSLKVPGVELAGVADLYTGHLTRIKELYGNHIFTTRDYRELLERKDIDAIIVSTPDFWHDTISIAAMEKGKAVYCEKPMVQQISEGHEVIATQARTKAIFQVGSQRVSSVALIEARKRYLAGDIGELVMVETHNDRHDALGAWQYSIPPDASPATVDFDTYLKDTPRLSFDPLRFFRWRNYQAYGTGIPGDLFVHLISGLHFITGSNGPERIYATGNLKQWKDGRDVPDVVMALFDYPGFQVNLRVNFADGGGGGEFTRIVGTEGVLELGWDDFKIKKHKLSAAPGYGGWDTYTTWPKGTQDAYVKQYNERYTAAERERVVQSGESSFAAPQGYNSHLDHLTNFYESVRTGKKVVEDATFGLRAAGPALLTNESYFKQQAIKWDPVKMVVVG